MYGQRVRIRTYFSQMVEDELTISTSKSVQPKSTYVRTKCILSENKSAVNRGPNGSDTDRIVVKSYPYPFLFFVYGYGSDIRLIHADTDWIHRISVNIYINIFIIYIKLYDINLLFGYGG